MTNQQHPITLPPELVEQWYETADNISEDVIIGVANRAAQWGADQELAACHTEVTFWGSKGMADRLQTTRRPKPLSKKEQALKEFKEVGDFILGQLEGCSDFNKFKTYVNNINFTLEQLND